MRCLIALFPVAVLCMLVVNGHVVDQDVILKAVKTTKVYGNNGPLSVPNACLVDECWRDQNSRMNKMTEDAKKTHQEMIDKAIKDSHARMDKEAELTHEKMSEDTKTALDEILNRMDRLVKKTSNLENEVGKVRQQNAVDQAEMSAIHKKLSEEIRLLGQKMELSILVEGEIENLEMSQEKLLGAQVQISKCLKVVCCK